MGGGGGDTSVEETPEQQELARIGVERMRHYEETLEPVENAFIDNAQSIGAGERELAGGMASSEVAQRMDSTRDQVVSSQMQSGAAPGTGRFAAAESGLADAEASAGASAEMGARQGSEDRRLSALTDVVNIGLGRATEGQQGMTEVAGRAARDELQDTQRDYMESVNTGSNLAAAGGLAASQFNFGGNSSGRRRTRGFSAPDDGYRG